MPEINWIAVAAATFASFAVGALGYSPALFAKAWQRAAGLTDAQLANGNMAVVFGGAFALGPDSRWSPPGCGSASRPRNPVRARSCRATSWRSSSCRSPDATL